MKNDENVYRELTKAEPKELLAAAVWFYPDETAKRFLRLGFKLAQPGGWEHIAPHWLQASKELSDGENEKEIEQQDD